MKYTIHYLKDSKNKYYFIVKIKNEIILTSRKRPNIFDMIYDAQQTEEIFIGAFKVIDGTDPVPAL